MNLDFIEQDFGDHKNLIFTCPFCGKPYTVKLDAEKTKLFDKGLEEFKNGALAQNAFPFLNADERELLISGMCPTCWDNM